MSDETISTELPPSFDEQGVNVNEAAAPPLLEEGDNFDDFNDAESMPPSDEDLLEGLNASDEDDSENAKPPAIDNDRINEIDDDLGTPPPEL